MLRLKRYQAPTRDAAYDRIREECGSDVEVVSTRNVRMPGLFGAPEREYVEVVVRVTYEELERRQQFAARLAAARAEAATQRANDSVRARSPRGERPRDPFRDVDDTATLSAAELAAAIAGEDPEVDDRDLAPEFVNEYAGRGVWPGELTQSGLTGVSPAAAADDGFGERDGELAGDHGPFVAMNAPAGRGEPRRNAAMPRDFTDDQDTAPDGAIPWSAVRAEAPQTPGIGAAEFRVLVDQVAEMKTMLRELTLERMRTGAEDAPGALTEARARLIERGITANVALSVLEQATQALPRNPDEASMLRTVERKLAAQLPAVPRVDFARRPVVIVLVGPSGAGKTTFAVRLALDIRAHSMTATVAGTDVGRAGGPQQLTAMGVATGVPVQICYSPGELQALVNEGSSDVVIVDTPGHTGARRDRMTELEAFMHATHRRHTLLVLPATMQAADLAAVTRAYQPLGLEGLVITRCDETTAFGAIASTAVEAGIGIAYSTHADGVSIAPRGGDNLMLARAVMAGQWPEPPVAMPGVRRARAGSRAG